jgi:hypothetical protein
MMGRQPGGQKQLFYSFNLDDHVPSDHLLRGIDHFLDFRRPASPPRPVLQPYRPPLD